MKRIICILLMILFIQQSQAVEESHKALICKEIPNNISYKYVDWNKTIKGLYITTSWYIYTKSGRSDLVNHTIFNTGANEALQGLSNNSLINNISSLGVFSLMTLKETKDKTGFSWSDTFFGNLPSFILYINWGKLYRGTKNLLGYKTQEPIKIIKMQDINGKKYACTYVDQKIIEAQQNIKAELVKEQNNE